MEKILIRTEHLPTKLAHMKEEYPHKATAPLSARTQWLLVCGLMLLAAALVIFTFTEPMRIGFHSYENVSVHLMKTVHIHRDDEFHHDAEDLPMKRLQYATSADNLVISCYYNFPNQYESNQLLPSDIQPHLCTHINVGFGIVKNKEIQLDDYQYATLRDIVKLKQKNPQLKVLLSVGGSGNNRGFSEMVIDHASRKTFIRSVKSILRNYTLDGVDLDWEFPALRQVTVGGRERQHFSQLLREIRMEYIREKRNYMLTIAVAAPEIIVDVSYDIDQLNQYVDYVNVMTYDFHFYTKYTPFTGLNSPLYARTTEHMYLATLNINYTVNMYIVKGLDPSKIVVGVPTYGHTFSLVNANNTRIGSPASGFGSVGSLGFINYPEVCTLIQNFSRDVTVKHDNDAKVPYLYRNKDWISYDTPVSVTHKANYIKGIGLRGAMIYSLNADDHEGVCTSRSGGGAKFPLTRSVKNALLSVN